MRRLLGIITLRFILLTNVAAAIFLCATVWLMGSDPRTSALIGFLPLLFPYFALVNLFYLLAWLWVRPRWSILSLSAILLSVSPLSSVIPFRVVSAFEMKAAPETMRIMTWNIRFFTPFRSLYYDPAHGSRFDHILDEVRRFNPDIVCFQEFTNSGSDQGSDPIKILRRQMGYKYYYFPGDDLNWNTVASGTAIFSKHPIVATENIRYDKYRYRDVEHTVVADIKWRNDTIRVYSIHLKSFGFLPNDYHSFQKIRHTEDTGLQASKSLFRKMHQTFYDHAEQADMVSDHIANSRYPQIICMDMNNVAHSYAYNRIKGDRQDVFAVAGSGLGKTYISPSSRILGQLPTLRIDHVLADPLFEVVQMATGKARLSDHRPVVADLQMAEKE